MDAPIERRHLTRTLRSSTTSATNPIRFALRYSFIRGPIHASDSSLAATFLTAIDLLSCQAPVPVTSSGARSSAHREFLQETRQPGYGLIGSPKSPSFAIVRESHNPLASTYN